MHYTTRRFWSCYAALPENVQSTADRAYELLKVDSIDILPGVNARGFLTHHLNLLPK